VNGKQNHQINEDGGGSVEGLKKRGFGNNYLGEWEIRSWRNVVVYPTTKRPI
jgi:hypothetical protein